MVTPEEELTRLSVVNTELRSQVERLQTANALAFETAANVVRAQGLDVGTTNVLITRLRSALLGDK